MIEEIKKTYNPFKMWGSWIGLITFILLVVLQFNIEKYVDDTPCIRDCSYNIETGAIDMNCVNACKEPNFFDYTERIVNKISFPVVLLLLFGDLGYPLIPIFGFLVGWGIHSLIRKVRK